MLARGGNCAGVFFLSSIVAGSALVILIGMWIARGWHRALQMTALASVGNITFWSLIVYLGFRLGDMALRSGFAGAFSGRAGLAFAAEILLGGVVPLILLSSRSLRSGRTRSWRAPRGPRRGVQPDERRPFAMTFRRPDALVEPHTYFPSIVEWSISIGLIAATIFLFGLGARLVPIRPKAEAGEGH
jgi:formate dehydrogenase iron-sulfur subunit